MTVIDASVAAKLLLPESHSSEALALATATSTTGLGFVAPHLLRFEIANIVLKRVRREGISNAMAATLIDQFHELPISLRSPRDLPRQALNFAIVHRLPAAYDAHYVALAMILGCDLWTADERLVRTLAATLSFVKWIGSYPNGGPPPA